MKLFLAKYFFKVGNIEENYSKIIKIYDISVQNECNLLIFPTMTFTGYPCYEKYLDKSFIQKSDEYVEKFVDYTKGKKTRVICGCPYFLNEYENNDGIKKKSLLHNSMILINDGYIDGITSKTTILKNNLFNDYRYFDKESVLNSLTYDNDNLDLLIEDDIIENKNIFFLKQRNTDFILCVDCDINNNLENKKNQLSKIAKWTKKNVIYFNNFSYDFIKKYQFNGEILIYNKFGELIFNDTKIYEQLVKIETKIINGELIITGKNSKKDDLFINVLARNYNEQTIIYEISNKEKMLENLEKNIKLISFDKKNQNINYIDYKNYIKNLKLNDVLKENIISYLYKNSLIYK